MDDPKLALLEPQAIPQGRKAEVREYYVELMQHSLFEIAWFSHEHRQLTDDYFGSWVNNVSTIATRRAFQTMWRGPSTKIMRNRFREYVEVLVAGITPTESVERGDVNGVSVGPSDSD